MPPPEAVQHILIWHQGALGDLLLAGPALVAVSRHYPRAQITALGHPERWGLLSKTLPLAAVWDSGAALWANLFSEAPLSPGVCGRLAPFDLALIFSPQPGARLLDRLARAGTPAAGWIPSFPEGGAEGECPAVAALQAQHLARLGLSYTPQPLALQLGHAQGNELAQSAGSGGPLVVAPGSGHACKNWPLAHFYEVSRALAWQHRLPVIWLAGPAETAILPYLTAMARAQGHVLLANQPLAQVAAVLARTRLYLGNDSGLTHLAAAAGAGAVLAMFGPTDPRIWAPLGRQVRTLTAPCPQAPCAAGKEIPCPEPRCLHELAPETVLAVASEMLGRDW